MTLDELAIKYDADKNSLIHDYCRVYERYFEPIRGSFITLLEIGCQFGHSAQTFLEYFPVGHIHSVDILNQFHTDNPRFHFHQGDLGSTAFWDAITLPSLNIVIDDAPHVFESSVVAFDCLWPKVVHGGLYVIEDLPCWWDAHYQTMFGGSNPICSMTEWIWRLLGNLNNNGKQYYGKPSPSEPLSGMETEIAFVHCHRGLIIIGKK